jgi:hypothetical protein
LARKAESTKLDAVFFADGPSHADNVRHASRFRFHAGGARSLEAGTRRITPAAVHPVAATPAPRCGPESERELAGELQGAGAGPGGQPFLV